MEGTLLHHSAPNEHVEFRVPIILTTPEFGGLPHHALEQRIPLQNLNVQSSWMDDGGNYRPAAPEWVSGEVEELVSVLKRDWLLYDLPGSPTPTCWPFVIPKTSEKVSLIRSRTAWMGVLHRGFCSSLGST